MGEGGGTAAGADLTAAQWLLHSLDRAGISPSQDKTMGYVYVRSPAPAGEVMQAGAVMHVVELAAAPVAAAAAVQQLPCKGSRHSSSHSSSHGGSHSQSYWHSSTGWAMQGQATRQLLGQQSERQHTQR